MSKLFFICLFFITVFTLYVLQVNASSSDSLQSGEKEKKTVLQESDPIHIGTGFSRPFSLEKPSRIVIPQIAIDLSVISAAIVDGYWEVSETFASHGQGSANPGQSGNMVIFAHARPHLFLNLQNITVGNQIYILTDKKWYAYTVSSITHVLPEQIEVIAPTTDERITLFTCSGLFDETRFIVVGKRNTETTFGVDSTLMDLLE